MFAKLRQKTIDEKASPSTKMGSLSDGHQRTDTPVEATLQAKSTTPAQEEKPAVIGMKGPSSVSQPNATIETSSQQMAESDRQVDMAVSSTPYRVSDSGVHEEVVSPSNKELPSSVGALPAVVTLTTREDLSVSRTSNMGPTVQEKLPSSPSPDPSIESPPSSILHVGKPSSPSPAPTLPSLTDQSRERSSPSPQLLVYDGETKETVPAASRGGPGGSDTESAASLEKLAREDLVAMFLKQRLAAQRYKGRFSEIMEAYKKLEREHESIKADYLERERKLNRKLTELKEVQELDRQAKVHMEETMRMSMEEKDEKLNVLTTQIRLLKERQSSGEVIRDDTGMQQLKQKVSEYETTLTKYKDGLRLAKEKILQLQKERDTLTSELKTKTEKVERKEVQLTADATDGSTEKQLTKEETPAPGEAQLDLCHKIQELEKKLEESRSSCAQLERTLEESRASNTQLEKRLQESSTSLNEKRVLNDRLEQQLEEIRSSRAQMERTLVESRASNTQLEKRLQEELNSLKAEHENIQLQLKEQNMSLQKDLLHLEGRAEAYERETKVARQALEDSRAGFTQRNQQTDEANQVLQNEVILLREQVSQLGSDLKACRVSTQAERDKLTKEWEAKLSLSLAGKDTDWERKHSDALLDRDTKHRSELFSVEEEHRKASQLHLSQLQDRQTEVGNLTLALEQARGEIITLHDRVTSGSSELQKYRAQVGVLEGRCQELENVHRSAIAAHEVAMSSLVEEHRQEVRAVEDRCKVSCQEAVDEQVRLRAEEKEGHARALAAERERLLSGFEQRKEEWTRAESEHREVVRTFEAKVAGLQSESRAAMSRAEVVRSEGEAAVKSLKLEMEALVVGKDGQLREVAASLRAQVDTLQASQHRLQATYDDLSREHTELLSRHESDVRTHEEVLGELRERLGTEVRERQQDVQTWESRLLQVTHGYQDKEDQLTEKLRAQRERADGLEEHLHTFKEETAQMMGQLEVAHSSRLQELERGYEATRTAHTQEMDGLQSSLQVERMRAQRLVQEHHDATEAAQSSHRQEVDNLMCTHQEELRRLADVHSVHLKEVEEAHASLLTRQEREAEARLTVKESELRSLLSGKEEQLSSVRATLEGQLLALKEAHASEVASLQENHKSELNRIALLHEEGSKCREKLEVALASMQAELAKRESEMAHQGSCWAQEKVTLEEKLRELNGLAVSHRSSLDDVIAEHRQEVENLKQRLEEGKGEADVLLQQHQVVMSQLKADHEKVLLSRDEQYQIAMSQLKEDHEKVLLSRDEQHQVAMSQLKADHENVLLSRGEQHQVAMSQLKEDHEQLLTSQKQTVAADVGKQVEGQWKDRARKLREELKKSMAINSELEAKLVSYETRAKEADASSQTLSSEIQKCKETISGLEASLKAKEGELAILGTQLQSSESQAEEKRLELKRKAESKIAALKKQLASQVEGQQLEQVALLEGEKRAREQLTKENNQLREEVVSLHKTLHTLKETAASGEEELRRVRQALKTREDEMRDLESRANGLADRAQAAEKRFGELESEHSQLSKELADLQTTTETVQSENRKLGQELAEKGSLQTVLTAERHTLEDQVQNLCTERHSLQATLKLERQSYEDHVKGLRKEVEEAERLCQGTEEEWKGRLDKVLLEVNLEREKLIQEHKRRIQEALSQAQTLQEQLRVCQENCEEAKAQLESARREGGQKITSTMSDMEAQLSHMQEDNKAKLDEVNRRAQAKVASVVDQCRAELDAKDRMLEELSARHKEDLKTRERELELQLSQERARMEELHQRLVAKLGQKQEELDNQVRLVQDTAGSPDLAGLQQMLDEARAEARVVKVALAGEEEKSFKLEERLADLRSRQESDMDALKQYHKQQLATKVAEKTAELRAQYEEAVSSLQERHSEEMRNIQQRSQAGGGGGGGGSEATGLLQLQSLVRRCKDELHTKESENLQLKGENQALRDQLQRLAAGRAPAPTSPPATPTRPDTPSKHVVLDTEPHGAEFEYFRNVLFQYMMGKQSKQLVKAIATLARFSDKQKGDLYSRLDV